MFAELTLCLLLRQQNWKVDQARVVGVCCYEGGNHPTGFEDVARSPGWVYEASLYLLVLDLAGK